MLLINKIIRKRKKSGKSLIYLNRWRKCFICGKKLNTKLNSQSAKEIIEEIPKANAKYAFHLYDTHGLPLLKIEEVFNEHVTFVNHSLP